MSCKAYLNYSRIGRTGVTFLNVMHSIFWCQLPYQVFQSVGITGSDVMCQVYRRPKLLHKPLQGLYFGLLFGILLECILESGNKVQ